MPSRKKAQGKARKAKQTQAAEAQSNICNDFSKRCNHLGERNWRGDDYDAAYSLSKEYIDKYNELMRVDDENLYEILRLAGDTYDKYHQLSDARKELFRKILLSIGTEHCFIVAKEKDLTKDSIVTGTVMFLVMIKTIEIRDEYNGGYLEIADSMYDQRDCPRQTIRFFHRRNSCDCLHEIYYKLKETTKKTSFCRNCEKVVEMKQLSRCDFCNLAQYCSYDCALADWPEHKVACEQMGCYKPTKTTKKSDKLEEVD
eukprot:scaffold101981_cov24-Cyclotella_meneghiniana.AAC.2